MAEKEEKKPGLDERLALGRLAEILEANGRAPIHEVDWVCRKYGFESGLDYRYDAKNRNLTRDEFFDLLIRTLRWAGFARFIAELMDLQLVEHGTDPYTDHDYRRQKLFERWWGQPLGKAIGVLGFEITIGRTGLGETSLVVLPTVGQQRQAETSKLRSILAAKHPNGLESLQGAYEAYMSGRTDGNRQAIESARNALEKVVRDFTGKDLGPGISEISRDDERTKDLLKELRNYLGVQGPHASESRSDADALLGIHLAEDLLVWILQQRGEW